MDSSKEVMRPSMVIASLSASSGKSSSNPLLMRMDCIATSLRSASDKISLTLPHTDLLCSEPQLVISATTLLPSSAPLRSFNLTKTSGNWLTSSGRIIPYWLKIFKVPTVLDKALFTISTTFPSGFLLDFIFGTSTFTMSLFIAPFNKCSGTYTSCSSPSTTM